MSFPDALLGAWRLTAFDDRDAPSADWEPSLGPRPDGVVVFAPGGVMSVHVLADPALAPPDAPPYVGWFGLGSADDVHPTTDGVRGVLRVRVEGAEPASLIGDDEPRPFAVHGDELTLGDGLTSRRVARRVG